MDETRVGDFFRNKWVRIILAFDAVVIIAVATISIIKAQKTAVLVLDIVPVDTMILVNGASYQNGTYSMMPGDYKIELSREGLESKKFEVNLEANHNFTISTFLKGRDNDFSFYKLKDNLSSFYDLEKIASSQSNTTYDKDFSAEEFIEYFRKNLDFLSNLPIIDKTPSSLGLEAGIRYQYDTLTIEDGRQLSECEETLCLHITDTSGEKFDYAISVIKKLGYNVDEYKIFYEKVDYE